MNQQYVTREEAIRFLEARVAVLHRRINAMPYFTEEEKRELIASIIPPDEALRMMEKVSRQGRG